MPFSFACPRCGYESTIEDHFDGRSGPCTNCGKEIVVVRPRVVDSANDGHETHTASGLALLLLLAGTVFFGAVGGLIYVVVVPQVNEQRQNAIHNRTRQHLVRISQALQAYHDTHNEFPPAVTFDANGKPKHSWRVLILRELGYDELYARYDWDQPWDSVSNAWLSTEMPQEYASATDKGAIANGESSFYVITGTGCPFPDGGTTSLADIKDGYGDTVLVAETISYGFSWLEPRDIRLARLQSRINAAPGQSFASQSPLGPQVLTADGEVRTLHFDAPADSITGIATIDGGEPIDWGVVAID